MQIIINEHTTKEQMVAISTLLSTLAGVPPMQAASPTLIETHQDSPIPSVPQFAVANIPPAPVSDRDASGMPWDARIHSSGKTQKKDGTWVLKKGVDMATVEQVRAEHMAAMNQPVLDLAADAQIPAPPTPGFGADPAAVFGGNQVPPPPVVTGAAAFAGQLTWIDLLTRVTQAKATNRFDEVKSAHFLARNGLAEFANLSVRPDLFVSYLQELNV